MSGFSIFSTTFIPVMTRPIAAYLPSSLGLGARRMKIWLSAAVGFWPSRYASPTIPFSNLRFEISATPTERPLPALPHDVHAGHVARRRIADLDDARL